MTGDVLILAWKVQSNAACQWETARNKKLHGPRGDLKKSAAILSEALISVACYIAHLLVLRLLFGTNRKWTLRHEI